MSGELHVHRHVSCLPLSCGCLVECMLLLSFLNACCDSPQAPMQQYSDLLAQRLQQRQAMRSTQEVPLGRGAAGRRRDDPNSEDDEEDSEADAAAPPSRRQPAAKKSALRKQQPAVDLQVWLWATFLMLSIICCCGKSQARCLETRSHSLPSQIAPDGPRALLGIER